MPWFVEWCLIFNIVSIVLYLILWFDMECNKIDYRFYEQRKPYQSSIVQVLSFITVLNFPPFLIVCAWMLIYG